MIMVIIANNHNMDNNDINIYTIKIIVIIMKIEI